MIEICNLRKTKQSEPWDFKVDRTTPLGNTFIMSGESEREWSCNSYERGFNNLIQHKEPMEYLNKLIETYKEYGKLRLFCWCAPKRCHSETIKRYIEETVK
jgi:hypothetical protein